MRIALEPRARQALRCAVCHDQASPTIARCERCGTFAHTECRARGCPTLGCRAGSAPARGGRVRGASAHEAPVHDARGANRPRRAEAAAQHPDHDWWEAAFAGAFLLVTCSGLALSLLLLPLH